MREAVDAANHRYGEVFLSQANQFEMLSHGIVGHMLGYILIAGTIIAHWGKHVGIALDIIDNLLFENGLQNHRTCTGSFQLHQVVNTGCQAATGSNDRTFQFQTEIFYFRIHFYNLFSV